MPGQCSRGTAVRCVGRAGFGVGSRRTVGGRTSRSDLLSHPRGPAHRDVRKLLSAAAGVGTGAAWKRLGYLVETLWPDGGAIAEEAKRNLTAGYARLDPAVQRRGRLLRPWRLWVNVPLERSGTSSTDDSEAGHPRSRRGVGTPSGDRREGLRAGMAAHGHRVLQGRGALDTRGRHLHQEVLLRHISVLRGPGLLAPARSPLHAGGYSRSPAREWTGSSMASSNCCSQVSPSALPSRFSARSGSIATTRDGNSHRSLGSPRCGTARSASLRSAALTFSWTGATPRRILELSHRAGRGRTARDAGADTKRSAD